MNASAADPSLNPAQRRIRALVCHGPLDLRLEHLDPDRAEMPKVLSSTQLRVRVAYGGICGSDLHYYQDGGFGAVRIKQPLALGHEISALVEEVGAEVKNIQPGQRIAMSPSRPCGACKYCQLGQQNQCLKMRFYGSAMPFPHIQGAFRDALVIEQHQAHVLAPQVSLQEAALCEPLSVGLHAIQRAGGVLGKQVLVLGCGPIGLLLIAGARRAGAARIVATDIAQMPLDCALKMGADEIINLANEPRALDRFMPDKGTFERVFECSGNPHAMLSALDVIAPQGVLVAVGLGGDIKLPMNQIVAREVDLRGTFRFHAEYANAVAYLNAGLIDVKPVITRVLPFDRAIEAFQLAGDKSQSLKVLIDFQ
ncbi:MAG: L-idonate 5-dehydrogenase [Pseudomonadota bacterium]|jgi:L-idonate 5-dehydrogenase